MNYREHCTEQGLPIPTEPVIFSKFASAICAPGDPIPWEVGETHLAHPNPNPNPNPIPFEVGETLVRVTVTVRVRVRVRFGVTNPNPNPNPDQVPTARAPTTCCRFYSS